MKLTNSNNRLLILPLFLFCFSSIFAQLNPAAKPGQNFDLSEWKLNYPMENATQENLSNFSNDYFYTDNVSGGMVFVCPNITNNKGGSSYPRCELRELLNKGASASAKSNNWTLSTNSSRDNYGGYNGVLSATLQVDRVSNTYDELSRVGRVIVGQIHGDDNEPCRIYYRLLPGHTKGSVYFAHEQSKVWGDDKQEFWHVLIGSKSSTASEPENGIALGEVWSYKIDVRGESMTVSIYDSTQKEIASKRISSDLTGSDNFDATYANEDNYLYFKAGVYNQNNGGEASDYAQATFFELRNTHGEVSDTITSSNLSISPSLLSYNSSGGPQTIAVASDDDWTAITSDDWISLSVESGNGDSNITVSLSENTEDSMREGTVTVTNADGISRSVKISQARIIHEGEVRELIINSAVASIENTSKGEVAANVLDNDLNSIWAANGSNNDPTLDLNLAEYFMVSAIEIGFFKQEQRETYFSVQYWDDTQYVNVLTNITQPVVDESQAEDLFTFNFPAAVPSNKIRVIGHGNSDSEWNSYREVNLYGWEYSDDALSLDDDLLAMPKIYPNPCNGTCVVENSLGGEVQIYNALGGLVFEQVVFSKSEKLKTDLPKGLYLLTISDANKSTITKKLIIK